MKKLGSSTFKGEFKIIKTFLTSLGFEEDRMGKHGSIWKHIEKNLTTNVTTSSSDYRWYKNWKSDFCKLVSENFLYSSINIFSSGVGSSPMVFFLCSRASNFQK